MKKVAVFNLREFDEAEWFEKYAGDLGLELSTCPDAPDMDNIASVTEGCECADIITSQITRELMAEFARNGIRYITTRTIGYDHVDLEAAREFGIHVGNAPYGPNGVADYTVMLILMSIRKMKRILERTNIQDNCLLHSTPVYPIEIGREVSIGHGSIIHGCRIADRVLVGMGAIIMNDVEIGENCIIGAGTLLTQHKKIPPNSLVMGAPGAVVRPLREEEIEKIAKNAEHYYTMSREHMSGEFQLAPQREENDA